MDPNDTREYWRRTAVALGKDPMGSAEQMTPLGLWGDDARYNRANDKITLFTFNCVLHTPTRRSSWFIYKFCLRFCLMFIYNPKPETLNPELIFMHDEVAR